MSLLAQLAKDTVARFGRPYARAGLVLGYAIASRAAIVGVGAGAPVCYARSQRVQVSRWMGSVSF
jgi:hypothetical protein